MIEQYLNFQEHPLSKGMKNDNEQFAILPSGSRVVRKSTSRGTIFQLFLNDEEYSSIKESGVANPSNVCLMAHFYGGNYIYLQPGNHRIIDICKFMKWNNN